MIDGQAPVEVFDEIDSTILEARRRAERNEVAPVWLIAKRQTAGRGRRGRTWTSHNGNLMATLLFTTKEPPQQIALLGFATGVALAETIDAVIGAGAALLKWPNDVFVNGAKISGIMLDSGAIASGQTWVALAFGVNLADAPDNIDQKTICLRDLLPPDAPAPEPLAFLAAVRSKLEGWDIHDRPSACATVKRPARL
jgi:BirA family biotin operon repressor/biotin-[acetyl-CoA-carboxylase] ligase